MHSSERNSANVHAPGAKRMVLIVDDDRDFAESLQDLLATGNYVARIAGNIDEALRVLTHFPAEVALLDIRLGLQSGIGLLERLVRQAPDILCIMITAYSSVDTAIEALRRGAYDYLAKPVRAEVLMATLKRSFDRIDLKRERDYAMRNLQQSEQWYRQLVEDSSAVPWEMDLSNWQLSFCGARIEAMTGIPLEDWLQEGFLFRHMEPEDATRIRQFMTEAMQGVRAETEFRLFGSSSNYIWLRCSIDATERVESGRVRGYLFDISDQVAARQQQERLQRQLQQAQRMEAIGYLTGGVAHDFNNILASVLGYTALAQSRLGSADTEKVERYLSEVLSAGKKAQNLVRRMLAYSRGGSGESVPIEIGSITRDAVKLVRASMPAGIELSVEIADGERKVLIDPVQLQQILMNLCINARDAVGESGIIAIKTHAPRWYATECASCLRPVQGEFVELSVTDTGEGMAADVLQHLFDPFFTTKPVGQGSGLGLSIVHGIVHDHNGHILVESQVGGGTRFRILMPAFAVQPIRRSAAGAADGKCILLVEDDRSVARGFLEALESKGYVTRHFVNAREALAALLSDHSAELLLVDQSLPELTGRELIGRLREAGQDIPVILYTRDTHLLSQDLQAAGIDRVIKRPETPEDLLRAVEAVIEPKVL